MKISEIIKTRKKIVLIVLAVIVAVVMILNPLRWKEYAIKDMLLEFTPVGTDMNSVIETLESKKNYEIEYVSYEHGYSIDSDGPSDAAVSFGQKEIGKKSMRVHLGEYRVIFCVDVIAFYGFNEGNELVDIDVRKDYDSL